MKLKDYSRKIKRPKTIIKSVNFTEKNHLKVKSKDINFSMLVNDFLKNNDIDFLSLEFNERLENNKNRIVSSLSIDEENIKKVSKINLSYLVNYLIEKF